MDTKKDSFTDIHGKNRKLIFGRLPFSYLKANREIVKSIGVKAGVDDLIEQEPFALESIKAGDGDDKPESLDDFAIEDISDILIQAMEANGFGFRSASPAPGAPAPGGVPMPVKP